MKRPFRKKIINRVTKNIKKKYTPNHTQPKHENAKKTKIYEEKKKPKRKKNNQDCLYLQILQKKKIIDQKCNRICKF